MTFDQTILERTETQILAYNDAVDFLTLNPTAKYEFDTGQSKQTVTRQDLANLQKTLDGLLLRRDVYHHRVYGKPKIYSPVW